MPINKFRFVSPGVKVAEIDNSQLPDTPADVGPVIIGRANRGPGLRAVQVDSMSDFVEIFGNPVPGNSGRDPWRDGPDVVSPAYGTYACETALQSLTFDFLVKHTQMLAQHKLKVLLVGRLVLLRLRAAQAAALGYSYFLQEAALLNSQEPWQQFFIV